MCTPPFCSGEGEGGGVNLLPNFQNEGGGSRGRLTGPVFKGGLLGKRGMTFFGGGLQFFNKK